MDEFIKDHLEGSQKILARAARHQELAQLQIEQAMPCFIPFIKIM